MKTIEENNKMIAEFMNVPKHNPDTRVGDWWEIRENDLYSTRELSYHNSWDWLMPVIEEIDHLEYESERLNKIDNALKTRFIMDVFNRVCEFIEWYNKENK